MCGRSSAVGLVLERWIDFTYRSSTDADGLSDAEIDQAVFGGDGQRVAQTVLNDVRRYYPAGDADLVTCCGSPFTARPGGCRRPTVTREANAGRCAGQASAGIRLARSFDERWTRRANQHRTAAGVRCFTSSGAHSGPRTAVVVDGHTRCGICVVSDWIASKAGIYLGV